MTTTTFEDQQVQWLGSRDVAPRLGVSPRTVIRLSKSGQLSYFLVGRQYLYRQRDVDAYLLKSRFPADK